jgi:Family of unknown function (DUF6788)
MKIVPEIPSSVRELATVLSQPKPMRRGSVSARTMKCGKASCPCQEDPKARHGPYYSLTRPVAGKTQSRYLSPEQAELARRQIEEGHKFREQVEHYREACEQWADAQLEGSQAAAPEAAEKKGSKRTFRTKLSRKSKPS